MSVTIEKINQYVNTNKTQETVELDYGEFKILAKTNLSIEQKLSFVESVVKDSFSNAITPSLALNDVAFTINFVLAACPDIPLPTVEADEEFVIDTQSSYDIIKGLDLISKYREAEAGDYLYRELKKYVKDRIDYEKQKLIAYAASDNASAEAINTFSAAFYNLDKLINVAIDQLDKNGNKLFKKLTDKNIGKWINQVTESLKKTNLAVNGINDDAGFSEGFALIKSDGE